MASSQSRDARGMESAMRLGPPGLGHMQRMVRKTIANSEKAPSASSFLFAWLKGRHDFAASGSGCELVESSVNPRPSFINDIERHRFPSSPSRFGGSIVCVASLPTYPRVVKSPVSVLRFLSHPDLNIDFPGVCPGPAPLPPDLTSIPPSHTNLKKLEGPRSSDSFSSHLSPSFSPIPL